MATLLSLPPETLLEIFSLVANTRRDSPGESSYYYYDKRRQALCGLSRISKRFLNIARTVLVENLQIIRFPSDATGEPQLGYGPFTYTGTVSALRKPLWSGYVPKTLEVQGGFDDDALETEQGYPSLFLNPGELEPFKNVVRINCCSVVVDLHILSSLKSLRALHLQWTPLVLMHTSPATTFPSLLRFILDTPTEIDNPESLPLIFSPSSTPKLRHLAARDLWSSRIGSFDRSFCSILHQLDTLAVEALVEQAAFARLSNLKHLSITEYSFGEPLEGETIPKLDLKTFHFPLGIGSEFRFSTDRAIAAAKGEDSLIGAEKVYLYGPLGTDTRKDWEEIITRDYSPCCVRKDAAVPFEDFVGE